MACAQAWRTASTTSPAPAAPASSTSTNSLRIAGMSRRHGGCFPGHRIEHVGVKATLVLDGSTWKVKRQDITEGSCPAGY